MLGLKTKSIIEINDENKSHDQCSQICSPSDEKPNFGSLSNIKSRKQNTNQNF